MVGDTVSTSGRDSFQLWPRRPGAEGPLVRSLLGSEGRPVPCAGSDHLLHTPTSWAPENVNVESLALAPPPGGQGAGRTVLAGLGHGLGLPVCGSSPAHPCRHLRAGRQGCLLCYSAEQLVRGDAVYWGAVTLFIGKVGAGNEAKCQPWPRRKGKAVTSMEGKVLRLMAWVCPAGRVR